MRSIDPRHLLQFHEIIRTGSFTRAAVTLGLTQPALTRNMKLMEGRLGFEIMVRSRQGIIPTALGARVLEEAGAVVLAERRISALTDNLKRGYETELRVGCTPTLSLHALPQPVADFARDNPSIRLDMRQAHSALLAKMLHDGHVDLVIGPPEIAARVPGTETVPLFSSPVVILASRFHPLAGRKTITNQDLNDARWILHQPGTGIREATDILLRRLGVNETLQASELPSNMILALLRLGDHLTALPRYVLRNMDIASELVQIAGEEPPVLLGHDAITMASQTSKTTGKFISAMRSGLGGLGRL
ncbi:MAG: LysR family transcriptional regulator [Pseudomonadota bacterium]|nr:LysR family transcriptional regulator [Pseudomonadota bacterium]